MSIFSYRNLTISAHATIAKQDSACRIYAMVCTGRYSAASPGYEIFRKVMNVFGVFFKSIEDICWVKVKIFSVTYNISCEY
jgi:hypothetical protein